jgi:serine/threonine protein kinase
LQQQASDSGEKYKGSSCRIPQEAAELIAKMLDLNPSNRISIADAKRSDFLRRTYHVNNR